MHLSFQSEIADFLTDLLFLLIPDSPPPKNGGNDQRQDDRTGGTKGDILEQPGSRHIQIFQILKQMIQHNDNKLK